MKNQEKIYITKMYIAILTFSRLLKSTKLYNLLSKKVYFNYPPQGFRLQDKFLINNPFIINLF